MSVLGHRLGTPGAKDSFHTNAGITNKPHGPGGGTLKVGQLVGPIAESLHAGIWLKMLGAAAEYPSQRGHERLRLGKALLECGLVEAVLRRSFILYVVPSLTHRR